MCLSHWRTDPIALECSLGTGGIHDIHQCFKELIIIGDLFFVFNHVEDFVEGELIGDGLKAGVFVEHFLNEFFGDSEGHALILSENQPVCDGMMDRVRCTRPAHLG